MNLVPITYRTKERFSFTDYRKHAALLADKIESLPKERHRQNTWANIPEDNECGTTGCALGIAAMSHIIPGLQFKAESSCTYKFVAPTIDGEATSWDEAGKVFFGNQVLWDIFQVSHLTREQVIHELRRFADTGRTR